MEKRTLLIVDDQADTRLVLSAWLKAHYYHTIFVADALQVMSVALKSVLCLVGSPPVRGFLRNTRRH